MTTTFRQKLGLILGSIFITLLFLELGFRLAGSVHLVIKEYQNRIALTQQDLIRVLCIGESTTFLGGETSYPSQLEKFLNNSGLEHKFKVINKGAPGINSDYIVNQIDSWLTEYNPHIVVAMMGVNDPQQQTAVNLRWYDLNITMTLRRICVWPT